MELLYADDLVLLADSEEGLLDKLRKWKVGMEEKGLRVNMNKTKVIGDEMPRWFWSGGEIRKIPMWSLQQRSWPKLYTVHLVSCVGP